MLLKRLLTPLMDQTEAGRRLLAQMALWWLAFTLAGTFVHAFLYRATADPMVSVTYTLTSFVSYLFLCPLSGMLLRRIDTLKAWRLGTSAYALVYTVFLLVGARAGHFPIPLGLLHSVGIALYWPAHHLLIYRMTAPANRAQFTALTGFTMTLAGMIVPPAAGFLIAAIGVDWGYRGLFGTALLLFGASALVSLRHGPLTVVPQRFMLLEAIKHVMHHVAWQRVMLMQVLMGIREGLLLFLPALLVFIVSHSEGTLGTYTLLVSLLSTVAFYGAGWVFRGRIRTGPLVVTAVVLALAPLLLWWDNGMVSLLLFGGFAAFATPFLNVAWNTQTINLMQRDPVSQEQPQEFQTLREITLILGRCISIVAFLWLAPQPDSLRAVSYILLVSSAAVLPATWLLVRLGAPAEMHREPGLAD